jgi:hypothetical protein
MPSLSLYVRKYLHHVWPILGYALATVVLTWPLLYRLDGWVPGVGDWGQNIWALWWTRKALLVLGQSPFFTHYLFYPEGVTLLFHPLDVSDGLIILPLYGLVGGNVSYNVVVLLSYLLSGLGVYWLVTYLTEMRWAGWVAGLIFTFSPYRALRLTLGHLNLASTQWIPFYLLCLLLFLRRGRWYFALLASFFVLLNALCSWYYVLVCGLCTLIMVGWHFVQPIGLMRLLTRLATVSALSMGITAPLWLPMIQLMQSTRLVGEHNPLRHSVDLLSFWVPGPPSSWAHWFEPLWAPYAAQNREPGASAYLGYVVLALAIIGCMAGHSRKIARWWLLVGLVFTLLALGPQLQVAGRVLDVRLAYAYLHEYIPGFSVSGIPGRLVVMMTLAMAVMAGCGVSYLLGRLGRSRYGVLIILSALIVLEMLSIPLTGSSTALPAFYYRLASDAENYSVLDIKWDANYLMYAQTLHGKPLVGGWLARLPAEQAHYLERGSLEAVITFLLIQEDGTNESADVLRPRLNESLARHRVRYIIDHNRLLRKWITRVLGWRPIHTEKMDHITVYAATP